MGEIIEVGDYVTLREGGRIFEIAEVEGDFAMLISGVPGASVKVRKEVLILCQKNP